MVSRRPTSDVAPGARAAGTRDAGSRPEVEIVVAPDVAGRQSPQQPSAQQPSAQQPSAQQPSAQQPSAQQPSGGTALRVRRAVTLLLMSVLVPGSAQLVAGSRRVGRVAVRVWLGLLVTAALLVGLWFADRSAALSLVTRPAVLGLAAAVCLVLAVAVPFLIFDGWRLGRPGDLPVRARGWVAVGTVVLVVATSVPLVLAGRRFLAAADLVGGVFGGNEAAGTSDGRYNVLLLGGDAGSDRVGLRPDSVTLASIDARTGRTVLFSLPRNLQNIPFPKGSAAARALPQGWSCGDACLLNAVYTWGRAHADLFPGARDPGAEAMKQAVAGVTGLEVSYYVLIDLHGFRALVDAMGGIDITVNRRVPIGGGTSKVVGYIEPGRQHLDGWHALWYARSRHGSSDYERMQRQRCVMTAMTAQMDPATLLRRFQSVASASKDVVSTDIPASDLGAFLDLGLQGKQQPLTSVQFVPPIITPSHPDVPLIRSRVAAAVDAAEKPATRTPAAAASSGPEGPPSVPAGAAPGPTPSNVSRPSEPGTDTDTSGTDVTSVCSA